MRNINGMTRGNALASHYHAQLGLHDKGHAIKGYVVCNDWDLEPLIPLNCLPYVIINYPLRYESYEYCYKHKERVTVFQ